MSAYELFRTHAEEVLPNYNGLSLADNKEGVPELSGVISLEQSGVIVDSYSIRIVPTKDYPLWFPNVFETENRIPCNTDWHVHKDSHFCLCTVPEEMLKCKKGYALTQFIEHEVKPFLYNQTHRRKYGYFINERSHGFKGELEYYRDVLHLNDVVDIARFFRFVLQRKEPGRTAICFCGSGMKYRKCHKDAYRMFSGLDDDELRLIFQRIIVSSQFQRRFEMLQQRKT